MRGERELKKGSTQTLILAVLADGPRHGYAIAREIERRSADALKMGEGSLYPALRTMEQEELVTSSWEVQPSGPARRNYKITEKGNGELERHKKKWQSFTEAVESVLSGGPHAEPA